MLEIVDPVICLNCGHEFFTLVKFLTTDTCMTRVLRCVKCDRLREDKACVPPAHAL